MEWTVLKEHFRAGARQDPCPCDEPAIEWDYSRYARALGMTAMPGLDEIPGSGCMILSSRPSLWEATAERYAVWAAEEAWSFHHLRARPNVVVPDALAHAIGRAVAGPQAPLFWRAGRAGVPAIGAARRVRSPGCSYGFQPGERWLIASDRVRRRTRTESALRGLLFFVSEAELLTAAMAGMLAYFARAHTAWRARMLSRDARIYLVLAVRPECAHPLRELLVRAGFHRNLPIRKPKPGKKPAAGHGATDTRTLGVEEEHLLQALSAAPYALAGRDVAAVFGRSSDAALDCLVERGFLEAAEVEGETCYVPVAGRVDGLPEPPMRVYEALLRQYRERHRSKRQGHRHLAYAIADLYVRLGRPKRAAVALRDIGLGNTACAPLGLWLRLQPVMAPDLTELQQQSPAGAVADADPAPTGEDGDTAVAPPEPGSESTPETGAESRNRNGPAHGAVAVAQSTPSVTQDQQRGKERHLRALHGLDITIQMAICAHFRMYDRARERARQLGNRSLRTKAELYETLTHILCLGRTHLDAFLPAEFWSTLKSNAISAALLEATAILCELFARLRLMRPSEIHHRWQAASELLAASQTELEALGGLGGLTRALELRVLMYRRLATTVGGAHGATEGALSGEPYQTMPTALPAYCVATLSYARLQSDGAIRARRSSEPEWWNTLDLARATGCPNDCRVQLGAAFYSLCSTRGLRLMALDLGDEQLLLSYQTKSSVLRVHMLNYFCQISVGQACRASVARIYSSVLDTHSARPEAVAIENLNLVLTSIGAAEFRSASSLLSSIDPSALQSSFDRARYYFLQTWLARKSLKWEELDNIASLGGGIERNLDGGYLDAARAFLSGSIHMCSGRWLNAQVEFTRCNASLAQGRIDRDRILRRLAISSRLACARLERTRSRLEDGKVSPRSLLERELSGLSRRGYGRRAMRDGAAYDLEGALDYAALVLNAWCEQTGPRANEDVLAVAHCLRRRLRGIGDSSPLLLGRLAAKAVSFGAQLRAALSDLLGSAWMRPEWNMDIDTALAWSMGPSADRSVDAGRLGAERTPVLTASTAVFTKGLSSQKRCRRAERSGPTDATQFQFLVAESLKELPRRGLANVYGYVNKKTRNLELACLRWSARAHGRTKDHVLVSWDVMQGTGANHADMGVVAPSNKDKRNTGSVRRRVARCREQSGFWGNSEAAVDIRELVCLAANSDCPVLIVGETGTGKEVVAREIHARSSRRKAELVIADCASLSTSLYEPELFGHKKGAFTGAVETRPGLIGAADGTSLFLDEVDSLDSRVQSGLLRVLETGEYRPVGSSLVEASDFRLIAAALPRLYARLDRGQFRRDLYFRISALRISIPPLRARPEDSVTLCKRFASRKNYSLSADALRFVEAYPWPGNVRQLLHSLDAAHIQSGGSAITKADFVQVLDRPSLVDSVPSASNRSPAGGTVQRATVCLVDAFGGESEFRAWDVASKLGISRRSAQRLIAKLLRERRIERLGAGRASRYRFQTCDQEP